MTAILDGVTEESTGSIALYRRVPLGAAAAVFAIPWAEGSSAADVYVQAPNAGDAPTSSVIELKHNWTGDPSFAESFDSVVEVTGTGTAAVSERRGMYLIGEITTPESAKVATIAVVFR